MAATFIPKDMFLSAADDLNEFFENSPVAARRIGKIMISSIEKVESSRI
jgi:hypothetical protein